MKRKILLAAVAVICLSLLGVGTLAYFTSDGTAHNVITTGGVDIELIETTDDGKPFPEEGISGVMPGESVTKRVTVKNTGMMSRLPFTLTIACAGIEELKEGEKNWDSLYRLCDCRMRERLKAKKERQD